MPNKEVARYADIAMYEAEPIDSDSGPSVQLLSCNNDPLGSIAAAAKAYKGEFVRSLSEVTDDERQYYLEQMQKTALAMPLEAVHFQFHISGVTRGFTHQMVRQRTAAYSQESTRFAVKDGNNLPVGLPPFLAGTEKQSRVVFGAEDTKAQYCRNVWDDCIEHIGQAYAHLVDAGMPAEDARGLLPTNLLTQINYHTNLRNFIDEGGKRLCTQAQFEWRIVFSKMLEAIRLYGRTQTYRYNFAPGVGDPAGGAGDKSSSWQFDAIANLFRPVCYLKGKCVFEADFDRACSIRDRVNANAARNVPVRDWGKDRSDFDHGGVARGIDDREWLLDAGAARVRG